MFFGHSDSSGRATGKQAASVRWHAPLGSFLLNKVRAADRLIPDGIGRRMIRRMASLLISVSLSGRTGRMTFPAPHGINHELAQEADICMTCRPASIGLRRKAQEIDCPAGLCHIFNIQL